jgi:hypothetical protein
MFVIIIYRVFSTRQTLQNNSESSKIHVQDEIPTILHQSLKSKDLPNVIIELIMIVHSMMHNIPLITNR